MMENTKLLDVKYKLPSSLKPFQKEMYIHLINWKWEHITKQVGLNAGHEYDAILPQNVHADFPHIYNGIKKEFIKHLKDFPFRIHKHFYHMLSSQAANINLFLPILYSPKCNEILQILKPNDFKTLAKNTLVKDKNDEGYRIEFWDEGFNNLNDKTEVSGTDSDIAIAYYNTKDELCLWLIEHKLTEQEFTTCGGYKSKGRDKTKHKCESSFNNIIDNKAFCYYHDKRHFKYWEISEKYQDFFKNNAIHQSCPFKGGMNQLWRNQLMALAIENTGKYKHVYFSVVHHPNNNALNPSMDEYKILIDNNPKFSSFTSKDVIDAAVKVNEPFANLWIEWYKEVYMIK